MNLLYISLPLKLIRNFYDPIYAECDLQEMNAVTKVMIDLNPHLELSAPKQAYNGDQFVRNKVTLMFDFKILYVQLSEENQFNYTWNVH